MLLAHTRLLPVLAGLFLQRQGLRTGTGAGRAALISCLLGAGRLPSERCLQTHLPRTQALRSVQTQLPPLFIGGRSYRPAPRFVYHQLPLLPVPPLSSSGVAVGINSHHLG
ncbi:hypothetical protein NDU88_005380 [Pleurodeles waltl]|uniref:Secreted protein n=1 Tax=Pleurodeles waltl TaxID=8319 RepID=A0AAV7PGP9_PLEWA|nr:hypothetical protein NDU88_005380 [Pleurodeles waltl]